MRNENYFPLGVFEDGNLLGGRPEDFRRMLEDVRAHGLDTVLFSNNVIVLRDRDADLLDVSDEMGMNVLMSPGGEFNEWWWPEDVPANSATARQVARPIVEQLSPHPSLRGYVVRDEPPLRELEKVTLMTQTLQELDPERLVMTTLVGTNRVEPIFNASNPDVLLINVYPTGYNNPIGDFTLTGFGYGNIDFVGYIREVTRSRPPDVPLWIILQTHNFGDGGPFSLREPVPAEVRAQNWLAIGEGATGIIWFVYGTQQGWTGLVDNEILFDEVASLAARVGPLRSTLLGLQKGDDAFAVAGGDDPYISTLVSRDGSRRYAVAVNTDCLQAQSLTITAPDLSGQLRDLETGQEYALGAPLEFRAGDGRIFELVSQE
jgi:hypothetical protein